MYAVISPEKIYLPPGTVVRLLGTWQDYITLSALRGDSSIPHIKYRPGEISLMSPLPDHGRNVNVISDVVKILLDFLGKEYDAFTPITIDLPEIRGIEPDYCFYIDNWEAISGKKRINWTVDPPPDLAIEIDVTSYTDIEDYKPYCVPEVWLYKGKQLKIYALESDSEGDNYQLQNNSRYFPNLNIAEIIQESLQIAQERNSSAAMRELRKKLHSE
jgi:Uma2 family endonuclease